MEVETFFTERWPVLRGLLARALAAAGVPAADREDVLQETALRLYQHRSRLDPDRSVDAYARVVALNVWRSLYRQRGHREVLSEVPPEKPDTDSDTERIGLARVELNELALVLNNMRPEQRDALLNGLVHEFTEDPHAAPMPASHRMARMRARKQLVACLQRTAAWLAAAAMAARELVRSGSASSASAMAGGTAALVVAMTALQGPHLTTPWADATPEPPASRVAGPVDPPRAQHATGQKPDSRTPWTARTRQRSQPSSPDRPPAAPANDSPQGEGQPPTEIDAGPAEIGVRLELEADVSRDQGFAVYSGGPDSVPACEMRGDTGAGVNLSCE